MTRIYVILSIAGWAWTVVFAACMIYRLRSRKEPRAFEVVEKGKEHL